MPANVGTQTVTLKFFDPADSGVINKLALDIRKLGIYSGGYLTKTNDTTVSLSPLSCEIGDGTYQVRVATAISVTITVATATPYIVLRWVYTGDADADYMGFVAVAFGGVLTTDVVVGKCNFSGSTLTGFDYSLRTNPNILDLFLKVESTIPASMYVRIRAGKVNYGLSNYNIVDQLSSVMVAPGSGSNVYAIQVNTSGAVIATLNPTTPPSYGGLVTLAEITIPSGASSITASMIQDVRSFVGGARTLTAILEAVYPVGSIYTSVIATNPATVFGFGTWSAFGAGRAMVGYNASDTDFNASEKTGGDKTHDHSASSMVTGAINVWTTRGGAAPAYSNSRRAVDDNSGGTDADIFRFNEVPVTGLTNSKSTLQPYITVFMWKRIA